MHNNMEIKLQPFEEKRRMLMYFVRLSILSLICVAVSGCTHSLGMIHDYELHDSGKPKKSVDMYFYEDNYRFTHSSEYYENGRLKSEEWTKHGKPWHRLEFYDSGQL